MVASDNIKNKSVANKTKYLKNPSDFQQTDCPISSKSNIRTGFTNFLQNFSDHQSNIFSNTAKRKVSSQTDTINKFGLGL